jgi:uncharacterized membrane protein (DUF2068 family)
MQNSARQDKPRRDRGLVVIALFKLVKAILLVVIAFGAFKFATPGAMQSAERWVGTLSSSVGRHALESALARADGLGKNRVIVGGIAALLYALLFAVEGIGLWMQKRWAEWLSLIATVSFIPFEIYEIVKEPTPTRITALMINVAVLVYLGVRLAHTHRGTKGHAGP